MDCEIKLGVSEIENENPKIL